MFRRKVTLSGGFCLFLASMVLFLPLPWTLAMIVAAAVHELGHYLAICACCGRGEGIQLHAYQARMHLPPMGRWQECVCALAGPAAGLSLLLVGRWMPRTAICALGQSVYNLMPIYPLDGGRALRCLLAALTPPPVVDRACLIVEKLCRAFVIILSVYASFVYDLGVLPLLSVFVMLFCRK